MENNRKVQFWARLSQFFRVIPRAVFVRMENLSRIRIWLYIATCRLTIVNRETAKSVAVTGQCYQYIQKTCTYSDQS